MFIAAWCVLAAATSCSSPPVRREPPIVRFTPSTTPVVGQEVTPGNTERFVCRLFEQNWYREKGVPLRLGQGNKPYATVSSGAVELTIRAGEPLGRLQFVSSGFVLNGQVEPQDLP